MEDNGKRAVAFPSAGNGNHPTSHSHALAEEAWRVVV